MALVSLPASWRCFEKARAGHLAAQYNAIGAVGCQYVAAQARTCAASGQLLDGNPQDEVRPAWRGQEDGAHSRRGC